MKKKAQVTAEEIKMPKEKIINISNKEKKRSLIRNKLQKKNINIIGGINIDINDFSIEQMAMKSTGGKNSQLPYGNMDQEAQDEKEKDRIKFAKLDKDASFPSSDNSEHFRNRKPYERPRNGQISSFGDDSSLKSFNDISEGKNISSIYSGSFNKAKNKHKKYRKRNTKKKSLIEHRHQSDEMILKNVMEKMMRLSQDSVNPELIGGLQKMGSYFSSEDELYSHKGADKNGDEIKEKEEEVYFTPEANEEYHERILNLMKLSKNSQLNLYYYKHVPQINRSALMILNFAASSEDPKVKQFESVVLPEKLMQNLPLQDQKQDYRNLFCQLSVANTVIQSQISKLLEDKLKTPNHILKPRRQKTELPDEPKEEQFSHPSPISSSHSCNPSSARHRRNAREIDRHYRCPSPDCGKAYGSEASLNQHIKLKHPSYALSSPPLS